MSTSWPAGISAPLTEDNEYNHSGLIVVLTAFTLVLFLVAIAARINSSSQKASFKPDDYAFAALVVRYSAVPRKRWLCLSTGLELMVQ